MVLTTWMMTWLLLLVRRPYGGGDGTFTIVAISL
jgi:hypothetical protein